MGDPVLRRATYDDVLNAPEGMTAEILAGELFLMPRPAVKHSVVEHELGGDLRDMFARRRGGGGPGGWWILREPELHLGLPHPTDIVAAPDLAGWRRDRLPELPDSAAIELPPDWIAEVLSPGAKATRRDRIVKPEVYASCGIPYLWILDPIACTLEVLRLQGGTYAIIQAFAGDVRVRAEPFEAAELDMGGWWLPPVEP